MQRTQHCATSFFFFGGGRISGLSRALRLVYVITHVCLGSGHALREATFAFDPSGLVWDSAESGPKNLV